MRFTGMLMRLPSMIAATTQTAAPLPKWSLASAAVISWPKTNGKRTSRTNVAASETHVNGFTRRYLEIMTAKAESQADLAPSPAGSPAAAEKRADKKTAVSASTS